MRCLRLVIVFFAFFVAFGLASASWVQAQEFHVYPPTAPCDGLPDGITFWFEGDSQVQGYTACDIAGLTNLGEYSPFCPLEGMTFDVDIGGCFFMEALPDDPPTGGHQPWREGERGHCDLDSTYLCDLWQQWIELPDESGNCPEGQTLVPGYDSVLEIDTCQYLSNEDTGDSGVVITGNGSESTSDIMILPNTGSGSIQHESGQLIFILAATFVFMTFSGCALGRSLSRS